MRRFGNDDEDNGDEDDGENDEDEVISRGRSDPRVDDDDESGWVTCPNGPQD